MSETNPSMMSYANFMCVFDEAETFSIAMCVACCLLVLVNFYFLRRSLVKYKEISSPNASAPWNKTYCEIALWNLNAMKA